MLSGYKIAAVGLGDGRAGDLPVLCGEQRDVGGDGGDELFAPGELAVGERLVGVGRGDFAVGDDERCGVAAPFLAAISTSVWRAAAAMVRRRGPICGVDWLPKVPMS